MAGTDNKTTAPVAPTAPAASGALQAFNNSAESGGAQVYVGKSSILGYGSSISIKDWNDRWTNMGMKEKESFVKKFNFLGYNVNIYSAYSVWEKLGQESQSYSQHGAQVTPTEILDLNIKDKYEKTVSAGPAFTSQDAYALAQGAFQQLLNRPMSDGDETNSAINLVLSQDKSTGATGRQQAVIDFIKNSNEYKTNKENSYLDAFYQDALQESRMAQA
jgi:hypothetical protein